MNSKNIQKAISQLAQKIIYYNIQLPIDLFHQNTNKSKALHRGTLVDHPFNQEQILDQQFQKGNSHSGFEGIHDIIQEIFIHHFLLELFDRGSQQKHSKLWKMAIKDVDVYNYSFLNVKPTSKNHQGKCTFLKLFHRLIKKDGHLEIIQHDVPLCPPMR